MTCSMRSGRITVSRSMPSWCWVRDQHRLQRHRLAVLVLERHLRLAVGAQVRHLAGLADLGQALGQAVGGPDRQRHQVGRLVAGVAEHHPLVAGALGVERVLAGLPTAHLLGAVHALGDVGDCSSIDTITPHVSPSNPYSASS